jgi:hypothetical protein
MQIANWQTQGGSSFVDVQRQFAIPNLQFAICNEGLQ